MEEKIIIKSQKDSISKLFLYGGICWLIVGVVFCIWGNVAYIFTDYGFIRNNNDGTTKVIPYSATFFMKMTSVSFAIIALIVIIAIMFLTIYWATKKSELIVTENKVYGKVIWGRRVDLPIDSVSAIGTTFLKGISISTSSGIIRFVAIKNVEQIRVAIGNLLNDRQTIKTSPNVIQQMTPSNADELKKYKELFDTGVISQEEFEAKKKQLLGL